MSADPTPPDRAVPRGSPSLALGRLLAVGARLTVLVLAVGLITALLQGHRGGAGLKPNVLVSDLRHGYGEGILGIGLVVLIITPVLREALALTWFARRHEKTYVILAGTVLALVTASVLIGGR